MTTDVLVERDDERPSPARSRRVVSVAGVVVAAYIAFVAVGSVMGLLIVHLLDHGSVGRADEGVEELLARHRDSTLNHVTAFLSGMASTLAIIAAALVLGVVWRFVAKEWKGLALVAIGLLIEVSTFVTIAALVDRHRPDVARLDQSPPTSSFPSGHTAASMVLYGAIAVLVFGLTRRAAARFWAALVAIFVPAAVAFGRLYRGMHHPTDVLVGVLLGIGALIVAALVVRRSSAPETTPISRLGP
ncbi:MAG: hypothetical protein QOD72_1228 [Acidimicrobiaceae bacterium]|jgi:undecaprenyl-diphosphatase|nr:hypothetical protein [Acidimicrobiaceae bacterium]